MNWQSFQTHNDSPERAFEAMCNQLFKLWTNTEYKDSLVDFNIVNGDGGDGGIESYATLTDGNIVGMQAKWFLSSMQVSQINQIKNSVKTALKIRPTITRYIVCIPRTLASTKMVKNGKPTENTESNRWATAKTQLKEIFPDLCIELWTETKLLELLQKSSGIYRYWFEKSLFSTELISHSFEKQKSGWLLSQKYTPSLHQIGIISKRIDTFLGNLDDRSAILKKLNQYLEKLKDFMSASDKYKELALKNPKNEATDMLFKKIITIEPQVSEAINTLNTCISAVTKETSLQKVDFYKLQIDFFELLHTLKEQPNYFINAHILNLETFTNNALNYNSIQLINDINQQFQHNILFILGEPGTGKTYGIANVVETYLSKYSHIPILIRAKDHDPNNNWLSIITKSLNLQSDWNEIEIWQALEAMSHAREINDLYEYKTNNMSIQDAPTLKIIPKIVIFLEGLDESRPYEQWFERINELNYIQKEYPRIKFCITSRPFVLREKNNLLEHDTLELPSDGDVSVNKLFYQYIRHFQIEIGNQNWIKWSLKTPLALRLFCEIYQNQHPLISNPSSVTITKLIQEKINKMNDEFKDQQHRNILKDTIINDSLSKISELFLDNECVSLKQLKKMLNSITTSNDMSDKVINFIEDYGLIQSYTIINRTALFTKQETYYFIGIQTFFDYIFALLIFENTIAPDEIDISQNMVKAEGTLQLLSILLLEEKKYLISNNTNIKNKLNNRHLFELVSFSLSNAAPEAVAEYKDLVKTMMQHNAKYLKEVVNRILIPVARIKNHPFQMIMLHEFLCSFDSPAKRDIIWSTPRFLQKHYYPWNYKYAINLYDDAVQLEPSDTSTELPLLYAWMLTSVDNHIRSKCRSSLLQWGKQCPYEFFKLFEKTVITNDIQMQEDLYSVLMSLVFSIPKDISFLSKISSWLIKNLFSTETINQNYNAAIRYYGFSIMKYAHSLGYCSNSDIDVSTPPYKTTKNILLNKEAAIEGTRMGGFYPIYYDLARYVLYDYIAPHYFKQDEKSNKKADEFLQKLANQLEIDSLTDEQFVISAAYAYIIVQGWNNEDFHNKPDVGKPDEVIGLDIAIQKQYYPATHGQKSIVMSFVEKYVWCARNEIIGYLSDRLPFYEFNEKPKMLDDYWWIDDFPNPAQEALQLNPEELTKETEWFIPENLSPEMIKHNNEDDIKDWVLNAPIPNFEKWLFPHIPTNYNVKNGDNNWLCLYNYNHVTNDQGGESIMWTSSGIIDKDQFELFLADIRNKCPKIIENFSNPKDFHSHTKTNYYLTPQEICWMKWKTNLDYEIKKQTIHNGERKSYSIIKAVEECSSNLLEHGEISYKIPSRTTRDYLKISDGDGYKYFNDSREVLSVFFESGDKRRDFQSYLSVDKDVFLTQIQSDNKIIFWVIRLLRKPSRITVEKYPHLLHKIDRCWLVWFDINSNICQECFVNDVQKYYYNK